MFLWYLCEGARAESAHVRARRGKDSMSDRPALEFPAPVAKGPRYHVPGADRYLPSFNPAIETWQSQTKIARRAPKDSKKKVETKLPPLTSPKILVLEKLHATQGRSLRQGHMPARSLRTPKALRRAKKMLGREASGFTHVHKN